MINIFNDFAAAEQFPTNIRQNTKWQTNKSLFFGFILTDFATIEFYIVYQVSLCFSGEQKAGLFVYIRSSNRLKVN